MPCFSTGLDEWSNEQCAVNAFLVFFCNNFHSCSMCGDRLMRMRVDEGIKVCLSCEFDEERNRFEGEE